MGVWEEKRRKRGKKKKLREKGRKAEKKKKIKEGIIEVMVGKKNGKTKN